MFFRKKKEEEKPKIVKKVYDFEEDKSEKINISELFEKATNGSQNSEKIAKKSTDTSSEESHHDKKLVQKEQIITISKEGTTVEDIEDSETDLNEFIEEENYEEEYEHKKHILKRVFQITLITAILLAIAGCIWVLNSPVFLIKDISINYVQNGLHESGEEKNTLILMLDNQINSIASTSLDENIVVADISMIKARIEEIPYVYKAEVVRVFPNTLSIKYSTRTPYAQIYSDNTYVIIDIYGAVVDVLDFEKTDIPLINGIADNKYKSGDSIFGTDEIKYKNIVYLLETADNIDFSYKISSINYEKTDELEFKIEEAGINVIYGEINRENINEKLLFLKEIIKKSEEDNIKGTLDISSENYYKSVLKRE